MNITEHAKLRMNQRGIQQSIIEYAEFFIPSLYENQSNKIFLSKKTVREEIKKIRKFLDML